MGKVFALQQLYRLVALPVIIMHWPLVSGFRDDSLALAGLMLLVILGFLFLRGINALVVGTADRSVRSAVRRGGYSAWLLLAATPLSAIAVFSSDGSSKVGGTLLLAVGVAVLIAYLLRASAYRTYVRSGT